MNRIFGGLWLVGAASAVLIGACGPSSSEVGQIGEPDAGTMPDGGGGDDGGGAEACKPGESRIAPDGCNTCDCDETGAWLCTEIGCECKVGETRKGEDGCSTCVCDGGLWQCDDAACATCTVGEKRQSGCNGCVCSDSGDGPRWECTTIACAEECKPGSTRLSDDMCSTCVCGTDGTWDCPPAGTDCGTKCEEGAMRPAGDDCNTCTCFHGSWGCTLKDCQPQLMCPAGFADCDGSIDNKCETNIETSVMNCGSCGNYCAIAGGNAACVAGKCVLDSCVAPYADCNGDPTDGCEVPTGNAGCKSRCEVPDGSPDITSADDDCQCPKGTTCVRNSQPGKGDLCYPNPEGCGGPSGLGTCSCLGSCVCPDSSDAQCTEQMAVGGVFILDCDGLN